jgi:hypothetical protein
MKQMLLAVVLVLTVGACSDGSAAKCDDAEKQLLTVGLDETRRELASAQEAFVSFGPLTLQNGDGYGMRMSQRDTALRNAQLRVADLSAFANENRRCFTDAERADLNAVDRQINAG